MSRHDRGAGLTRRNFLMASGGLMAASTLGDTWMSKAWSADKVVNSPVVEIESGRVRGQVIQGVNAYYAIPYGASTAGANRFMPPQKPQAWSGVRDTLTFGPVAPQLLIPGQLTPPFLRFCFDRPGVQYTEDCLNLNVWSPKVNDEGKRPVLVWIHGGGFTVGSSSPVGYDGANLARQNDVVVVSINHRLNAFGFLDLGSVSGSNFTDAANAGMLDIVASLQWVRNNIARFGGDPGRVTIFGESGGGAKVSILMTMPSAKGLFHRAVIESGPAIRTGERRLTAPTADALLKELGITAANLGKMQQLTQEQITAAAQKIGPKFGSGFSPLVEGKVIPRHPFDPTAPEISRDVPLLIGYNRTEATLFVADDPAAFKLDEAAMRGRVEKMVGAPNAAKVIDAYRAAYPKANPSDVFFYLMTDRMFALNSMKLAARKTALGGAPAYLYRFDWQTPFEGGSMRAPHTVEIPFVFNTLDNPIVQDSFGKDPATRKLGDQVSSLWAAFARTGKPEVAGMPKWPAYTGAERSTLLFNNQSTVVADPDKNIRLLLEGLPPAPMVGG